jgi:hypothetical protein
MEQNCLGLPKPYLVKKERYFTASLPAAAEHLPGEPRRKSREKHPPAHLPMRLLRDADCFDC